MKYYKGYPEVMGIDGCTVTLHDIERTMLSLYWDNFVCEPDKTWLLDKYKEERMDYLDGIFCFDDAIRSRLEEVERLWMNARQCMAGRIRRMAASEQEKARRSEKHASLLRAHIEVGNLEDTDGVGYCDDERDLWDILFGEDRYCRAHWGFLCESIYIDEKENTSRVLPCISPMFGGEGGMGGPDGMDADFFRLKSHYRVAWQDMLKISRFYVTVDMHYN